MAPHPQRLHVTKRSWPLAQPFAISRGSKTTAEVVIAELHDGDSRGRGECVPYPRYGESVDSVFAALEAMKGAVFSGLDRTDLQKAMPPGAARNALDAAFWDIDAKRAYCRVTDLAGDRPDAAGGDRLHAEPRHARADGRGRGGPARPAAAQAQTHRRRRYRAGARSAPQRAAGAADRRRQRGLDCAPIRRAGARTGRVRRRADRATAPRRR